MVTENKLPMPVICECGFSTMDAGKAVEHAREHSAMDRISRIKELLEEYRDCSDELDSGKIAIEIDSLYREDIEIADNMRDYFIHVADGAER